MTHNLELSHQQQRAFQPQKLSAPRDFIMPQVLVDAELPLVLEIGAGKGKHALSFAQQNPDKRLIAIERTRNKFEAFAKLATNIEAYMDNAEQQANELWCLPNTRHKVASDSQRTHFEVKYLARGETCWQLNIRKPEGYQTRFDT